MNTLCLESVFNYIKVEIVIYHQCLKISNFVFPLNVLCTNNVRIFFTRTAAKIEFCFKNHRANVLSKLSMYLKEQQAHEDSSSS